MMLISFDSVVIIGACLDIVVVVDNVVVVVVDVVVCINVGWYHDGVSLGMCSLLSSLFPLLLW